MDYIIRYFKSIQLFFKFFFSGRKRHFVYVAIGDSTVEGYGATKPERGYAGIVYHALQETYPNAIFYNLGVSNSTISDVLQNQLPKISTLNPDLITISIGANDIRFHTSVKQFEQKLGILLDTIEQQTRTEVVINSIPDFSLLPIVPKHLKTASKVLLWRFNQKIKHLALRHHIIFVDLYHQSRVFTKHFPEAVFEDGFHPSDFGYALWANTIISNIQHILVRPSFFLPT